MRWCGVLKNWIAFAFFGVMTALPSQATTVRYDLSLVVGNTWQYDFSVANDSLATAIDEFTIYFDRALFSNLQLVSAPADWDPLAIQPDLGLPQDGYFDWLAMSSGIAPGRSAGSFQVRVDFGGNSTPGASLFEVVDPTTFDTLDRGFTTPTVTAVPEPSSMVLLTSGLLLAMLRGRSRSVRKGKGKGKVKAPV